MSKVKYDGWAIRYQWSKKLYPPVFDTRATLIRKYEHGIEGKWRSAQRKGIVKAVKVRLVEVEDV